MNIKNKLLTIVNSQTFFFILILLLSTNISFFLGKLSENYKLHNNEEKISILQNNKKENIQIIASKKGTTFYFPWCSGSFRIKDDNKIYFKNKKEAIASGLRLAKGCEDIKN